jgi:dihydroorotase
VGREEERDRDALIRAVCSGDPKFFLQVTMIQLYNSRTNDFLFSRSDSALHLIIAKHCGVDGKSELPPGVFTSPFATQYVILALEEAIEKGVIKEEDVTQEQLELFLGGFGRQFYRLPNTAKVIGLCLREKARRFQRVLRVRIAASKLRCQEAGKIYSVEAGTLRSEGCLMAFT